jgi:hypothetical protein
MRRLALAISFLLMTGCEPALPAVPSLPFSTFRETLPFVTDAAPFQCSPDQEGIRSRIQHLGITYQLFYIDNPAKNLIVVSFAKPDDPVPNYIYRAHAEGDLLMVDSANPFDPKRDGSGPCADAWLNPTSA